MSVTTHITPRRIACLCAFVFIVSAQNINAQDTTSVLDFERQDTVHSLLYANPTYNTKPLFATTPQPAEKPTPGPIMFFYRLGRIIEHFLVKGIDTTYLQLHNHSWRLAFTTVGTGIYNTLNIKEIPKYPDASLNLRSSPSVGLGFAVAWHTIQFNYSWDVLYRRTRKLDFAILNRAWGIELTHHVNTNINGILNANNTQTPIKNSDVEIATTFLSAYFIFNSEQYSTNAALRQSYIQKKSAGSFYLQAQYLGTKMSFTEPTLSSKMEEMKNYEVHQAAVSAGYGYNYTPNEGKFLLHISAAPMAIVFNRTILTFTQKQSIVGERYKKEITLQKVIDPKLWIYITGTARVSATWNVNDWFYIAGNAQFNNMRFNSKKDEDLSFILQMNTWEWNANLTIGARFGISREKMYKALERYEAEKKVTPHKDDILDWVEHLLNKRR